MTGRLLRLRPDDDVAVAIDGLAAGDVLGEGLPDAVGAVPPGHKVALLDLAAGADVRKYGQVIGRTTRPILAGEHVHIHNLAFVHGVGPASATGYAATEFPPGLPTTFLGYRRADGTVATRNYIGIVTSVNCAASTAELIARRFENRLEDFPHVDAVVPLTHDSGCGLVTGSEGAELFERTLLGTALHPNFAALVVVGLGCEMLVPGALFASLAGRASEVLTIQDQGGIKATVDAGVAAVERLLPTVNEARRELVGLEHLALAVKCGGSDGYSGISANPALGHAADLVVAGGGKVVIGETPEIHGAEHLLTSRAVTPEVGQALMDRMAWWKDYTARNQGSLDNNPSPGNKAGGITTILEKSLGAAAKAGTSPLVDVVRYAEPLTKPGLTFMDTPGYDPVSVTGMIAGGANVVVFTTGRGSVFGSRPAPCIKVSTNTAMYTRMAGDMDLNAGVVVDGDATVEEMGERLFRAVVEVASGRKTVSEELGVGGHEFMPWHLGAVV
jgi:altronate hydrolase